MWSDYDPSDEDEGSGQQAAKRQAVLLPASGQPDRGGQAQPEQLVPLLATPQQQRVPSLLDELLDRVEVGPAELQLPPQLQNGSSAPTACAPPLHAAAAVYQRYGQHRSEEQGLAATIAEADGRGKISPAQPARPKPRLTLQRVTRPGPAAAVPLPPVPSSSPEPPPQQTATVFGTLFRDWPMEQASQPDASDSGVGLPWLRLLEQQQEQERLQEQQAAPGSQPAAAGTDEVSAPAQPALDRAEVEERTAAGSPPSPSQEGMEVELAPGPSGSGRRFSLQQLWQRRQLQQPQPPAAHQRCPQSQGMPPPGHLLPSRGLMDHHRHQQQQQQQSRHPPQHQQQQLQGQQGTEPRDVPLVAPSAAGPSRAPALVPPQTAKADAAGAPKPSPMPAPAAAVVAGAAVAGPSAPQLQPQAAEAATPQEGAAAGTSRGPGTGGGSGSTVHAALGGGAGPCVGERLSWLPPVVLEDYLPDDVAHAMREACGMTDLYAWQAECLNLPGVIEHGTNLVYQAPTGSGKSIVAWTLMLRALARHKKRKALLILPLRRACEEQAECLTPVLDAMGREVKCFYGARYDAAPLGHSTGVLVCTCESANSLLNRLQDSGVDPTGEFSCVVLDEAHMLQDSHRGAQYEMLLAKLRYKQRTAEEEPQKEMRQQQEDGDDASCENARGSQALLPPAQRLQIVCMSATLPGPGSFAKCLGARCYITDFRPIALNHFLVCGGQVEDNTGKVVRRVPQLDKGKDPLCIATLCQEAVDERRKVLVFCATKALAVQEARRLKTLLHAPEQRSSAAAGESSRERRTRAHYAAQLRALGDPDSLALAELVEGGAAYDHSKVPGTAKALVADAYREGAVAVLCTTTTLSSSVNLPAFRVVFRQAWVATKGNWLTPQQYHQMAGRAGRKGLEEVGEAFLVLNPREPPPRQHLLSLISSDVAQAVASRLEPEVAGTPSGLRGAMLEAVAGCGARTKEDVFRYLHRCTIAAASARDMEALQQAAKDALAWLGKPDGQKELAMIEYSKDAHQYQPTPLGRAVVASALPMEEALVIRADMLRLSRRLSLLCDLQLCYLSVPPFHTQQMLPQHWKVLSKAVQEASQDELVWEALGGIGISQDSAAMGYLHRRCRQANAAVSGKGRPYMPDPISDERDMERLCSRLYTALALQALIADEADEGQVQDQFQLDNFRELRLHCSHFSGKAAAFASRLGWTYMAAVLKQFQRHIKYGSKLEVSSLTELSGVDVATARLLFNSGLCTLEAVAEARLEDIVEALSHTKAHRNRSTEQEAAQRRQKARSIKTAAAERVEDPLRGVRRNSQEDALAGLRKRRKERLGRGKRVREQQAGDGPPFGKVPGRRQEKAAQQQQQQEEEEEDVEQDAEDLPLEEDEEELAEEEEELAEEEEEAGSDQEGAEAGGSEEGCAAKRRRLASEADFQAEAPQQQQQQHGVLPASQPQRRQDGDLAARLAAAGLPSSGLFVLSSQQEVRSWCGKLRSVGLPCIGFSLHYAPGGSKAPHMQQQQLLLPEAPAVLRKRRHELQGAQHQEAPQQQVASMAPGALLGTALSWADGAAAYIPLSGGLGASQVDGMAAELVALLGDAACGTPQTGSVSQASGGSASSRGTCFKATVSLQQQLPALQQLAALPPGSPGWRAALPAQIVDVRVAAWLLRPENSGRLSARIGVGPLQAAQLVLSKVTGHPARYHGACAGLTEAAATGQQQPLVPGWLDACCTAAASRAAWEEVQPQLQAINGSTMAVLLEQEMPLAVVLAGMEAVGVGIDTQHLQSLRSQLEQRRKDIELEIARALGRRLDLSKFKEVSDVLFGKLEGQLGLQPPPCAKKLKRGGYSANKEVMQALVRLNPDCPPVVKLIAEHRRLAYSVWFIRQLLQCARAGAALAQQLEPAAGAAPLGRAGGGPRIWTVLHQTNSDTGRLAMDDPSLQCVPRTHELRMLLKGTAREGDDVSASGQHRLLEANVRKAFVAAPGCVLLGADYRAIELRMMAHFSQDEKLLATFQDGQHDPFRLLAAKWLGKELGQVSQTDRQLIKHLQYGIIYGMGDSRLGEEMGVTPKEAAKLKQEFLESMPGVAAFLEKVVEDCRQTGYVETLAGRRCPLPNINLQSWRLRGEAERKAVNTPMQGSAADVMKAAMIALGESLQIGQAGEGGAAIVLMIHDELVIEVQEHKLQQVAAIVRECMEVVPVRKLHLSVPLAVKMSMGRSWGDLKEVELLPL